MSITEDEEDDQTTTKQRLPFNNSMNNYGSLSPATGNKNKLFYSRNFYLIYFLQILHILKPHHPLYLHLQHLLPLVQMMTMKAYIYYGHINY